MRMQGAAFGGLIAAIIYATLPARGAHGTADFFAGAILLAVLAQPAFVSTFLGVREQVARGTAVETTFRQNIVRLAAMVRRSSDLRRVLLTILAAGLSVTVMNKSILFLFDRLDAIHIGLFVAAVPSLSLLITAPAWLALARRFNRVATLLGAAALNAAAAVALAFADDSIVGVMIASTIALVAGCGMSIMFWSLLPRAVAAVEDQYKRRADLRSARLCARRDRAKAGTGARPAIRCGGRHAVDEPLGRAWHFRRRSADARDHRALSSARGSHHLVVDGGSAGGDRTQPSRHRAKPRRSQPTLYVRDEADHHAILVQACRECVAQPRK